jgi:hypothetical protein
MQKISPKKGGGGGGNSKILKKIISCINFEIFQQRQGKKNLLIINVGALDDG